MKLLGYMLLTLIFGVPAALVPAALIQARAAGQATACHSNCRSIATIYDLDPNLMPLYHLPRIHSAGARKILN